MYNRISILLSKNQKIGFIVFFISMLLSSALEIIGIGALSGIVYVLSSFDTTHTLLQKYGFINFIQLSPDLVNSNFFLPAILLVIFLTKAIVTFIINFFDAKRVIILCQYSSNAKQKFPYCCFYVIKACSHWHPI